MRWIFKLNDGAVLEDLKKEARSAGVPAKWLIARAFPKTAEDVDSDGNFVVMEENWVPLQVFIRCITQLKRHVILDGGGKLHFIYDGFDYAAVDVVLRMFKSDITDEKAFFEKFRILEAAAISSLNSSK